MRRNHGSVLLEYASVVIPTVIFTIGMFDAFTAYQTLSALGESASFTAREFARMDGESVSVTPDTRDRRTIWRKYALSGTDIDDPMAVSATYTGVPLGETPAGCASLQPREFCDFELDDSTSGTIGHTIRSTSTAVTDFGMVDLAHSLPQADFSPGCTGAHCAQVVVTETTDSQLDRRAVEATATYNHPLHLLGGMPVTFSRTVRRPLEEGFIDDAVRQSNPTCTYREGQQNTCE